MHKFVLAGPGIHRMPPEVREYVEGLGVRLSSDGLKMFGCYVGKDEYVRRCAAETINGHTPKDPTVLRHLQDTRGEHAVLSLHFNGKGQYISRHTEMPLTKDVHEVHNAKVDAMLAAIIGDDPKRPLFREVRSLPRKKGGMGLGQYGGAQTASSVTASRLMACNFAQAHIPFLHSTLKLNQIIHPLKFGELEGVTEEELEVSEEVVDQLGSENIQEVVGACKVMVQKVHEGVRRGVLTFLEERGNSGEENTKPKLAYFRSAEDPNAGKFIGCAHGIGYTDPIGNKAYRAALIFRMLGFQRDRAGQLQTKCLGCNKKLVTVDGVTMSVFEHSWSHAAACKYGTTGPFSTRHNSIVQELATLVRRVENGKGLEVLIEFEKSVKLPGVQVAGAQGAVVEPALAEYSPRIDLSVQEESGKQRYIDVAIADPGCSTYLAKGSHSRADVAAEAREHDKRSQFKVSFRGIHASEFVPFVVESTGRVGPAARAYLASLDIPPELLRRFFDRVSMLCAKNLGRLVLHSQGVR